MLCSSWFTNSDRHPLHGSRRSPGAQVCAKAPMKSELVRVSSCKGTYSSDFSVILDPNQDVKSRSLARERCNAFGGNVNCERLIESESSRFPRQAHRYLHRQDSIIFQIYTIPLIPHRASRRRGLGSVPFGIPRHPGALSGEFHVHPMPQVPVRPDWHH